jgi:hypothetical protein
MSGNGINTHPALPPSPFPDFGRKLHGQWISRFSLPSPVFWEREGPGMGEGMPAVNFASGEFAIQREPRARGGFAIRRLWEVQRNRVLNPSCYLEEKIRMCRPEERSPRPKGLYDSRRDASGPKPALRLQGVSKGTPLTPSRSGVLREHDTIKRWWQLRARGGFAIRRLRETQRYTVFNCLSPWFRPPAAGLHTCPGGQCQGIQREHGRPAGASCSRRICNPPPSGDTEVHSL